MKWDLKYPCYCVLGPLQTFTCLWGLMTYYSSIEKLYFFHLSRNLSYTETELVNQIDGSLLIWSV